MMSYVLVKYNSNWADEMDIEGFFVLETDAWEQFKVDLDNHEEEVYYCIGTNEEIYYGSGSEVLNDFSATDITEEQYKVLVELGLTIFGFTGPDLDEEDY